MIDITGLREDKRPQSPIVVHAILDRLEATEEDRARFLLEMGRLCAQCDALRAKIAEMEQQEPVAYLPLSSARILESGVIANAVVWNCRDKAASDMPLYALPGAQPAPSVPEGWKLVPIEVIYLYSIMCAAFVPMTPQQKEIALQLELAKRAMLAVAPEAKP